MSHWIKPSFQFSI